MAGFLLLTGRFGHRYNVLWRRLGFFYVSGGLLGRSSSRLFVKDLIFSIF
jgi:hypothetical protein